MSDQPEEPQSVIGLRTALILFGALAVWAIATLKGTALAITLVIVLALAVKAYIHHLRKHIE